MYSTSSAKYARAQWLKIGEWLTDWLSVSEAHTYTEKHVKFRILQPQKASRAQTGSMKQR